MAVLTSVNVKNSNKSCVSNPIHHSRFDKLESALNELFLKELNSNGSIFIKIAPNTIKKMAMFMSGMALRPAAVGVCGETASGKSTIVLDSMEIIQSFAQEFMLDNIITRINTDDYYYDRSKEVKSAGSFAEFVKNYDLDIPDAIELSLMKRHIKALLQRQEVYLPKYDMSGTAIRKDNCELAKPSSVIISEGLYTLVDEIADVFDFKIYVDIDKSIQKDRFFERAQQRGLGDSANRIFENASKKAQVYIHPCAENADIIVNGQVSRKRYKEFIASILSVVEDTYFNFAL